MTLQSIKQHLRNGQYAWPGGYPMYFVTADGAALTFADVRGNWREVVSAHLSNNTRCGWFLEGADINWEDTELYSDHSNERIESAYGEEE